MKLQRDLINMIISSANLKGVKKTFCAFEILKFFNSYFLNSKEEFFETLSKEIDKKISTEKGEVNNFN